MGKIKSDKKICRKGLDEELLNNVSEVKSKQKLPKQRMRKESDKLVSTLLKLKMCCIYMVMLFEFH